MESSLWSGWVLTAADATDVSTTQCSYVFRVSSKSVQGFGVTGEVSKFSHSSYFGYRLLQQLVQAATQSCRKQQQQLECGPMPNGMAALPHINGALCSTPQSLADTHY